MRIGTKIGLGINALLAGTFAVITANHVVEKRAEWEKDRKLMALCSSAGIIPADLRCLFVKHAEHNSPALLAAVARQESGFRTNICSINKKTGKPIACGLMQFVPSTAAAYKVDVNDALSSVRGSDRLLRDLLVTYKGNTGLALAAYNCGPTCINNWRAGKRTLPEETRGYVLAITGYTIEAWTAASPPRVLKGHIARMQHEMDSI